MNYNGKFLLDARIELGYSREYVSEMIGMPVDRLVKIETNKVKYIHPADVKILAEFYEKPELHFYFCKHECALGEQNRDVKLKDLGHIAIEAVNSLNKMSQIKDRLLDIAEDETVSLEEHEDFQNIRNTLEKIALAADDLKLWCDKEKM